MKFNKTEVDSLFRKVDRGILEYRKAKVLEALKIIWTVVWTVTIFPLIILWHFISGK